MTKTIDDIALKPAYWKYDDYQQFKQALREAILTEVIGGDEYHEDSLGRRRPNTTTRNNLRVIQRQRLDAWLGIDAHDSTGKEENDN